MLNEEKNEKEKNELLKRYGKVCKELESLAFKEYPIETGKYTIRQAKISRKCDYLAMAKMEIKNRLFDEFNIEV